MKEIEQRMRNLEIAFIALVAVSKDHCAPALADAADRIAKTLFESAEALGGPFYGSDIRSSTQAKGKD